MSNPTNPPTTPRYQPGQRVAFTPAPGLAAAPATVDGVSAAQGQPPRYHILVDGELDGRQVDEATLAELA